MAITLDELLGRNTQTVQPSVERFPSYEEFQSSRTQSQRVEQNNVRYNFDMAPAQPVRSVESVRNYEQSRPYIAPQSCEYQSRDYAFYQNLQPQAQVMPMQQVISQPVVQQPVMMQPVIMAQPVQTMQPVQQVEQETRYQFAAQESELSEQELFDRLSHTSAPQESVARASIFQRRVAKTEENKAVKERAKLNTKGKLIIAAYAAVIAIVVSLIAVNASKINKGEAMQPAAELQDTSIVQIENK